MKEHELASKFMIEQNCENAVILMKRIGNENYTTQLYISSNKYNLQGESGKKLLLLVRK